MERLFYKKIVILIIKLRILITVKILNFLGLFDMEMDVTPAKKLCLDTKHPVDLNLEHVLGKMPQKTFKTKSGFLKLKPLQLPQVLVVF